MLCSFGEKSIDQAPPVLLARWPTDGAVGEAPTPTFSATTGFREPPLEHLRHQHLHENLTPAVIVSDLAKRKAFQ